MEGVASYDAKKPEAEKVVARKPHTAYLLKPSSSTGVG